MKDIGVIGCWHQGVVGAACLADMGFNVLAADRDAARIAVFQSGKSPLYEPGLDDLIRKGLDARRLRFTADVAEAARGREFVFLMFDTPVDQNDQVDLTIVFETAAEIAPVLADDMVLYVTAQVPVGSCDRIREIIRQKRPGLKFAIAYSPENLRLGQAIERFRKPPLPVLGSDDPAALDRLEQLLAPMGVRWERVNLRTAEMTKHALNSFLAVSICFANELGNLCDEVGANGFRLAEVLRLEPRIGAKAMLFPGLGFSGGTLARDMQTLRGLGDRAGFDTKLLDGAWESNRNQNQLVRRKLKQALGALAGKKAAVFGLTYKPDTSTLRRSASLEIIGDLVREGMVVCGHDPKADRAELAQHKEFTFNEDPYEAAREADAVVLITGWTDYKTLDYARIRKNMRGAVLLDTQNMLDADKLGALGFVYLDVGRGHVVGGKQ